MAAMAHAQHVFIFVLTTEHAADSSSHGSLHASLHFFASKTGHSSSPCPEAHVLVLVFFSEETTDTSLEFPLTSSASFSDSGSGKTSSETTEEKLSLFSSAEASENRR